MDGITDKYMQTGAFLEFSSFKPATRVLLVYAYQYTLIQNLGFADRKLILVGPLS